MIEVKGLVKRYGSHVAVDHLSLTMEDGKVYGLLGPNGAGKSTTMNMMTGYLSATEGEILVNGHNVLEEPEEARACIGYLPEQPPLYPDMTVEEYLTFCAELKKVAKGQRKGQLEAALEMARLQDVRGRLIGNLSKGYRQRVGLAQAILGFPPIIILDEPTVGLDPRQIIEIRELIRSLRGEHTVILSSHILSEVQEVCDEVVILSHGRLVACDRADQLEARLRGAAKLSLTVKGTAEAAALAIAPVPGIVEAQAADGDGGAAHLTLEAAPGEDPREALFYALAEARLPILELRQESASLEQVFLELTGDQAPAPAEEGHGLLTELRGRLEHWERKPRGENPSLGAAPAGEPENHDTEEEQEQ